jgi:hypothetical protein
MFMHTLDHVQAELESDVQEEQVLEVFEGPQATSCIDTNIAFKQGKPGASHQLSLTFLLITIFMIDLIVH